MQNIIRYLTTDRVKNFIEREYWIRYMLVGVLCSIILGIGAEQLAKTPEGLAPKPGFWQATAGLSGTFAVALAAFTCLLILLAVIYDIRTINN
jgi:hypothetical protein